MLASYPHLGRMARTHVLASYLGVGGFNVLASYLGVGGCREEKCVSLVPTCGGCREG